MDDEKLIHKYVEALGEEYEAFYLYKHIFKHLGEKAHQAKVLTIMEEEIKHYEAVFDMLFPVSATVVHSDLEHAFKLELIRMKDEMRGCLEKLKKM
jgi:hypothetical protein